MHMHWKYRKYVQKGSSQFIVYFLNMFVPGFVLANDPGTSVYLFIIFNVYWECLATESINEIDVNGFKNEMLKKKHKKTLKYISKYNTIYKDLYP